MTGLGRRAPFGLASRAGQGQRGRAAEGQGLKGNLCVERMGVGEKAVRPQRGGGREAWEQRTTLISALSLEWLERSEAATCRRGLRAACLRAACLRAACLRGPGPFPFGRVRTQLEIREVRTKSGKNKNKTVREIM